MKIMNRIKITKNRVVACFAAILLLLPATVGAQHFDAHIAGRKVTLQECFDLAARQNLQMQVEGQAYGVRSDLELPLPNGKSNAPQAA